MPNIKDSLLELNPWWNEKFTILFKDRFIYSQIQKYLPLKQMIAFTGLRRVGKTTLMLKIAEDLMNKLSPKHVIYFTFDEFQDIEIRDVIRTYEEITGNNIRQGRYLLLLDEVQKLENWENQVKVIYDTLGNNVKIMLSGSESLFIRKKSKETLAGRIFEFKVEPLFFSEFLGFKGVNFSPIGLHEKELKKLFNQYLLTSGFPDLVEITDKSLIKSYIKEGITDKIIYKDIPKLFKVTNPALLESLLNIISEEPGQIIQLSNLAIELGISRKTIPLYLNYLENSFLIRKLYNFSRSRRKVERKLKRYYPSILSVDLLFKEDDLSKSKVFECSVVNQLKGEFFWRDPYKNEVDLILVKDDKIIPIEIKYGKIEIKGLLQFMKKFSVQEGYVISQNKEGKQEIDKKSIHTIPAFQYLLGGSDNLSK